MEFASARVFGSQNDPFQAGSSEAETVMELVKRELSLFRRIQGDGELCEDALSWWPCHESRFQQWGYLQSRF